MVENKIITMVHTSAGKIVEVQDNDHAELGDVFYDAEYGYYRLEAKTFSKNDDGRVFYRIREIAAEEIAESEEN